MFMNDALAYVTYFYNKSTHEHLKRTIDVKFSHEDLLTAKGVLLFAGVKRSGPEKGRQTSENRTSQVADVCDLMEMLAMLDEDTDNNPIFGAVDMLKVGSAPREEITNAVSPSHTDQDSADTDDLCHEDSDRTYRQLGYSSI